MNSILSRGATFLAFGLTLLFAPDCTTYDSAAESEEVVVTEETGGGKAAHTDGVVLSAALWTFEWNKEGVTFRKEGGIEIETDLGYKVVVNTARILTHSVSFAACDTAGAGSTASAGSSGGARSNAGARSSEGAGSTAVAASAAASQPFLGLPIKSAYAHTENVDPSMIETSLIEDLVVANSVETGTSFAAAPYCKAHWLVARPLTETEGPTDFSMANRSLYIVGTYERDGFPVRFSVDTWWPDGILVDLADVVAPDSFEAARLDGKAHHAFVKMGRHLGSLFDGVDFDAASQDQVTGTVLDNLVDGTDIQVELWAPSDPG